MKNSCLITSHCLMKVYGSRSTVLVGDMLLVKEKAKHHDNLSTFSWEFHVGIVLKVVACKEK